MGRMRCRRKDRVQFFMEQQLDVGRGLQRRRLGGLLAHELRHRRTAVGEAATGQHQTGASHQCDVNDIPPHRRSFTADWRVLCRAKGNFYPFFTHQLLLKIARGTACPVSLPTPGLPSSRIRVFSGLGWAESKAMKTLTIAAVILAVLAAPAHAQTKRPHGDDKKKTDQRRRWTKRPTRPRSNHSGLQGEIRPLEHHQARGPSQEAEVIAAITVLRPSRTLRQLVARCARPRGTRA